MPAQCRARPSDALECESNENDETSPARTLIMNDAMRPADPVCGMGVSPGEEVDRIEHEGTEYLFCSTNCAEKFRASPSRYLKQPNKVASGSDHSCCGRETSDKSEAKRDGPKDAIYTCPMHPEICHVEPGDCPKYDMALEPVLRDMPRQFWVAIIFAAQLLVYVMDNMLFGNPFESWISPAEPVGRDRARDPGGSSHSSWCRRWERARSPRMIVPRLSWPACFSDEQCTKSRAQSIARGAADLPRSC